MLLVITEISGFIFLDNPVTPTATKEPPVQETPVEGAAEAAENEDNPMQEEEETLDRTWNLLDGVGVVSEAPEHDLQRYESDLAGRVSSYVPSNASSMGCQLPDETVRTVSSVEEHRDNSPVDTAVPPHEARDNAATQAPWLLEPTSIRLPEGSASKAEFSGVEEHWNNSLVDDAVPSQEARADAAPQAPSAAQTPRVNSVPGVAAEVSSQLPCSSHRDVRRKTKELKAKLRKQRDLNRRLQARLQRQRQALTVQEVVRSVRSHVSPAVAELVEAQLRMNHLWLKRVPLRVGFFPQIFDLVKRRAATFSMSDRACCIVFDEMHIKKELSYNPSHDRFEGLEEYDGVQGSNLCNKALVFMAKVSGLLGSNPLAIFLLVEEHLRVL
ncbi:hypothetical protein HPB48_022424 [Haemaphysalis longicornis]|uniref:Transposable element P transposase-like RNase H domain-containing protein n=1 Tax=Haemaphysalis longicornis TaxID=44386 RepID=A0A9J6G882_HAELO|nr:hypothetical protein HPB48_022424 [Haemaphysalis longicornis]